MHCTMDDNPNLSDEFKEAQRRLHKGVFYQRLILGLWVMAEGAIYKDVWEPQSTFNDEDVPAGLLGAGGTRQRVVSIDYGTNNPFVALDWRDDGQTCWCMSELRWDSQREEIQKTDRQYAQMLDRWLGGSREPQVVVDPSAASLKLELMAAGFWVIDADNDVLPGIQTTATCLAQGVARFHRRRCAETIREFESYAWDPKSAARGVEQPLHAASHGPDAARYFCQTKIPQWRLMDAAGKRPARPLVSAAVVA
jgi:hypothetical protein